MKEKSFMLVSNNRVYYCEGIEELKKKINTLDIFKISYQVYYQVGSDWTEMYLSPQELFQAFEKGLNTKLTSEVSSD